jgi:hypothetical protein
VFSVEFLPSQISVFPSLPNLYPDVKRHCGLILEIFQGTFVSGIFFQEGQKMASLRQWMDKTDIDVFEAARAFGVSIFAVKKWLRGERVPRPKTQTKIKRITKGSVTAEDWLPKEK